VKLNARLVGTVALFAGIVAVFAVAGGSPGDSPEHRTDSDAANGASALPQLAQALGHPTTTFASGFAPDLGMGVLFVLEPTTGFSRDDARQLSDYVSGGGAVVYAAAQGDAELDLVLHVNRLRGLATGDATGSGPMLAGVTRVSGDTTVAPLSVLPGQVVLLRSTTGQPIAYEQLIGRGRVVVMSDPLPLCNGYLQRADNARLAAALVSLAPGGSGVAFDEYHHEAAGGGSPLTGWLSTAWGAAIAWAAVALFAGLVLQGRAFGPRRPLPGGGRRSTAEHVAAVGSLLERSRSAAVTGRLLASATRRALAARHGLPPGPDFGPTLEARAPAAAAELAAAEAALGGEAGDAALAAAARRLHRLAYPEQPRS
jgi:hypothetical protein